MKKRILFSLTSLFLFSKLAYPVVNPVAESRQLHGYKSTVAVSISGYRPTCTGVLISDRHVLTAAHCNFHKGAKVVFTDYLDMFTPQDKARKILKVTSHSKYKYRTLYETPSPYSSSTGSQGRTMFDIAVVEFEGDVPDDYEPAEIKSNFDFLNSDELFTGFGFGFEKSLPRPKYDQLGGLYIEPTGKLYEVKNHVVQMRSIKSNAYHCIGDSGGGIFLEENGKLYVLGIQSYVLGDPKNYECDRQVAHFTRVDSFYSWIRKAME